MKSLQYDIKKALKENCSAVETAMKIFFDAKSREGSLATINEAQVYSLLGGGKRIRPFLVNEVCRMLGGDDRAAMPFAMAVEMIHTYSLIHDDLPCMDDDDLRRGRPTNHKVYGEAAAVLAGDALLTNAFLAASSNRYVPAQTLGEAVTMMANAAGDEGMIGGQIIDIEGEGKELTQNELLKLHSLKTGKMIELSACLGALAAGCGGETKEFAIVSSYARKIGLAFQVVDDILDVTGDESVVGKTLSSDEENGKTTFLTFYSIKDAKKYAEELTSDAIEEISVLENSEGLQALAQLLLDRNS